MTQYRHQRYRYPNIADRDPKKCLMGVAWTLITEINGAATQLPGQILRACVYISVYVRSAVSAYDTVSGSSCDFNFVPRKHSRQGKFSLEQFRFIDGS